MPGQWLTDEQIHENYGLSLITTHYWRRVRCAFLGGRRLRVKPVKGKRGGVKHLFWEPDIRKVAEAPCWDGTLNDDGGEWYSSRVAFSRFRYSRDRLQAWRKRCPLLPCGRL